MTKSQRRRVSQQQRGRPPPAPGEGGVLAQLGELKAWFEEQTLYHFYSASILFGYDANAAAAAAPGGGSGGVRVKLVDFAHVDDGDGVIDHNFLGGLCSLIKFIGDIVAEVQHCVLANVTHNKVPSNGERVNCLKEETSPSCR
uniref:Inositol polyphosphate multikinase n=1 Tax=Oryza barthii TaxID=65489 RepID=A0A0D3F5T3_9ORYZ